MWGANSLRHTRWGRVRGPVSNWRAGAAEPATRSVLMPWQDVGDN